MKIYLAGPLFTGAEFQFNKELAVLLETYGYEVWLPQEKEPRDKTPQAIFEMDVQGLDWADIIVANMDGPDPDSGTCWECGYAYALGKAVLTYRTDLRSIGETGAQFNLMLSQSSKFIKTNIRATPFQLANNIRFFLLEKK